MKKFINFLNEKINLNLIIILNMSFEFKNTMLSNYKIKKILGKGTFSTVKLAVNKDTGEEIAIKILEKYKIKNARDLNRIEREISMVKNINHPNIANVFDIKEDEDKYYILMEYCENGELFDLILGKHKLNEEEASYFYYQIINGLEYIHINNIIHRDLKPENLLLTKNNILKIIDFGLSNYNTDDNLLSTPCGSPCYASPEMVSGRKYNGFTSDIWSTGIILYAMIYGYLPFENINNNNDLLFRKISECRVDYPRNSCFFALDLLKQILVPDPNKRIKIPGIKKHKFYLKGKSIFNYRNKELKIYNNFEGNNIYGSENNSKIYINENSIEEKYNSYKHSSEKRSNILNHEKIESDNYLYYNDDYSMENDEDSSYKRINKLVRYKNRHNSKNGSNNIEENLDNNISNKKILSIERKNNRRVTNIEEEYFSQLKLNEKRNTYNDINNNLKNNLYNINSNNQRRNNFILAPSLNMDKIKYYDTSNIKEERKDESKISRKKTENHKKKLILTSYIPNQNSTNNKSKSKNMEMELIPYYQSGKSECIVQKKMQFPDKFPELKSYSIEQENGYIYQALSNLKKVSPLNIHKKNIKIKVQDDNKNNKTTRKRENNIIIKNEKNKNSNTNLINKTDNDVNQISEKNTKFQKIKKYSSSVQKKKDNENNENNENKNNVIASKKISVSKNINVRNNNLLKKIEETKDDSRKDSFEEINRTKTNIIKNSGLNNYFKFSSNSKSKEIQPISIINFNPNNSFLINTSSSDKKDLNLTFLKKSRLNKKNSEQIINSKNYSFNSDIKQFDNIHSFISQEKIKNKKENRELNEISKQSTDNHLTRNNNEIRSELNNNIIFSTNYRVRHTNNKSLEDNYFKGRNNIKIKTKNKENIIENKLDNNEKIKGISHKRVETIKRNINNNYNNNYIKIISDSKDEININKLQKKPSGIIRSNRIKNANNENKENIVIYQGEKRESNIDDINGVKNKDGGGHKYYKDKKDNLRLTINKVHNNKISDDYLTKVNYSSKAHNSNNINKDYFLKYDIDENINALHNTQKNDIIHYNHETYTYIHRNINENQNLSNKCLKEKKQNNNFYKFKILNENKKNTEFNNTNKNSVDKNKNNLNEIKKSKWINSNNIINNISKINMSGFPSITIDMNVLNKNNMKYLKFYDSIKNKL